MWYYYTRPKKTATPWPLPDQTIMKISFSHVLWLLFMPPSLSETVPMIPLLSQTAPQVLFSHIIWSPCTPLFCRLLSLLNLLLTLISMSPSPTQPALHAPCATQTALQGYPFVTKTSSHADLSHSWIPMLHRLLFHSSIILTQSAPNVPSHRLLPMVPTLS